MPVQDACLCSLTLECLSWNTRTITPSYTQSGSSDEGGVYGCERWQRRSVEGLHCQGRQRERLQGRGEVIVSGLIPI